MFLDIIRDEELAKLPRVTSQTIKQRDKFHPEGIFSEQIFGPVQSFTCWCNTIKTSAGRVCPECGIKIVSSSMRRRQFAVIEMPEGIKLINPIVVQLLTNPASRKLKNKINAIMSCEYGVAIIDDTPALIPIKLSELEVIPEGVYVGSEAIKKLAEFMVEQGSTKSKIISTLKDALENDWFFTKFIVVIPPDLRPALLSGPRIELDGINRGYQTVLEILQKIPSYKDVRILAIYEMIIQQTVNNFCNEVLEAIGKNKTSLVRNNLLGKRVDFSGRAVAVVDPNLKIDEIRIPKIQILQLYKLEIAAELLAQGKFATFKSAIDYIDEMTKNEKLEPEIEDMLQRFKGEPIILNRQPSLHKGSVMQLNLIPSENQNDYAIAVNPLICNPLNLDFDGDSVDCKVTIYYEKNGKVRSQTAHISELEHLTV